MGKPLRIISLGWGVQSFALAAMSALGELPPVDAAVHADTTHERSETYAFAAKWPPPPNGAQHARNNRNRPNRPKLTPKPLDRIVQMCYNTRMDTRTDGQQPEPELESAHITLPRGLKLEAKIKAMREGKSLSQVIRELLTVYVQK